MFYDMMASVLGIPESLGMFGNMLVGCAAFFVFILVLMFLLEFFLSFRKYFM